MADNEKEKIAEETPTGRDYFLNMMREENPDYSPADDDAFLGDIHGKYSKMNEELSRDREANGRLAELVGSDPRLGSVMSMMLGEDRKSLPYAIAKTYGKDFLEDDIEEFEAGYKEYLDQIAANKALSDEAAQNIETFKENLARYVKENDLSEEDANALLEDVYSMAEAFLTGNIPVEVIDVLHKGKNYSRDMNDAANTSFVEGKNEKIRAELREKGKAPLPSLAGKSGGGEERKAKSGKRSFFDGMKEE